MADEGFKRKLTAILSADVIGYSRLMRDNEEATVRDITAHRALISDIIQQHHGRVVDSPGDNILAEFASVVDAINGAIKIQKEIKGSNTDTPENRRMEFRIGINMGDVIEEDERIYGDGVNIAARVEGLATGGGIAISGIVYDSIKDKLSLGYHYLGEQEVKNIPEPVRIYRLLTEPADAGKMIGEEKPKSKKSRLIAFSALGLIILVAGILVIWNNYFRTKIEPASVEKMAYSLPDKPSIAVLPFNNLSGNPEDEYIADGISESIITALSKTPKMFVISRNSTFTYKGKAVKIQKVAEDLSVQYVLEGSLQKSNDQLRIHAQLLDAITGNHLWAEKYDRNVEDIFALQDDITMKIITALQVTLSQGEQANITARGTDNLEAYLKFLQGQQQFLRNNREGDDAAQKIAKDIISLEPTYPSGYYLLAQTHFRNVFTGASKNPKMSLKLAIENAQKAISLDESLAVAHALLGFIYTMTRQYEKGIAAADKALALNPNSADIYLWTGYVFTWVGRCEDAINILNKSVRLSPIPRIDTLFGLCIAYRDCERYEEGIAPAQKAILREPDSLFAHTCLAGCYAALGRNDEAKAAAAEVLRIEPEYSLAKMERSLPYKNPSDTKRVIGAMRKAGIPE
jgi:adenylate cyclase